MSPDRAGFWKHLRERWRWSLVGRKWASLSEVFGSAPSEEKVRGFLAFVLVAVLLALVFWAPGERDDLVASTETLAIAVVAFYFGLHKDTVTPEGEQVNAPGRNQPS